MRITRILACAGFGVLTLATPSAAILYVCPMDTPGPCAAQQLAPSSGEVVELYVHGSNGVNVLIDVSGGTIQNFVPNTSEVVEYHPSDFSADTRRIRIAGVRSVPADSPSDSFRLGSLTINASSGSANVAVAAGSRGVAAGDAIDVISPAAIAVASSDVDRDGVPDPQDNCLVVWNPAQRDANSDGYGNLCDADLNDDGFVNFLDLGVLKSMFLSANPECDLNGDGICDSLDIDLMKRLFFQSPGPSGLVD